MYLKIVFVATVFELSKMTVPISLVFDDEFLAQGLHLGVQLGLGLGFLQTSQVLPQSFLLEPCLAEALSC